MGLCSSCDGAPLKIKKEKWPGLQFTRTNYLSLVLTPLRIHWKIPLNGLFKPFNFIFISCFVPCSNVRCRALSKKSTKLILFLYYTTGGTGLRRRFCKSDSISWIPILYVNSQSFCMQKYHFLVLNLSLAACYTFLGKTYCFTHFTVSDNIWYIC
jgi:hypothetical protein